MIDALNTALSQFHFIRPFWLLLLLPAAYLSFKLWHFQSQTSNWQSVVASHLLPFLMDGETTRTSRYPLVGLFVIWLLLIFALAGPTSGKISQPIHQSISALVIAWDMSPSMLAQDVKPSRLVRSRLKLIDLLRERNEGLTALIAYSGQAHVVTPLTDDTETIISLLKGLHPHVMPAQGSNTEMALELANQLLKDGGIPKGDVLFVTDGIAQSAITELGQIHDASAHTVSIWGVGTNGGAPIPLKNGGFAYDRNGEMVIAKLNENTLSATASELGGVYIPFSQSDFDLISIKNFVLHPTKTDTREVNREFDQWFELGPYLLLLILPFAALAFRRGWLLSFGFVFIVAGTPQTADAYEWQDLWKTKDQRAAELLQSAPETAATTFKNEDWKAIAHYKAGNFDSALESFKGDSAQAHYNRGIAQTHLGNYDDAIQSYNQALSLDPNLTVAADNLAIAEKLKSLQENQQQGEDGENSQDQDSQEQNSEDKNSQQNPNDSDANQKSSGEQPSGENSKDQQQNSDSPQKGDDQKNGEQGQQGEQGESQQGQNEESDQPISEEQKQALEQAYGEQNEDTSESEDQSTSAADTEQEADEKPQSKDEQQAAVGQEQPEQSNEENAENDEDAPANGSVIRPQISREEQEAEQSLEQWLRKVPDDPSGLLRNKFQYEHGQRKRTLRQQQPKLPDENLNEERW